MNRLHPIYILYDAKKWIPFLLIPVLRALFKPGDAVYILLASIRDTGLALLLIAYSILKWKQARYSLHDGLTLDQGLINRRRLRLMGGRRRLGGGGADPADVAVRSPAGADQHSGAAAPLGCHHLHVRLQRRPPSAGGSPPVDRRIHRASVAGNRHGRLQLQRRPGLPDPGSPRAALGRLGRGAALRPSIQRGGAVLYLGSSPAESMANLFVLGWAFSFLRSLMRYAGFYARQEGEQLHLVSGLVTRRDVLIDTGKITTLELRQTLFMKLFRLRTATITAAGYGREKGARPVIVPGAGCGSSAPRWIPCCRIIPSAAAACDPGAALCPYISFPPSG